MPDFAVSLIRSLVILTAMLVATAYLTWFERRVIGRLQARLGPNRVGTFGLLQPLADALKLLFKEDILPSTADRFLYLVAPGMALFAAFAIIAVLPFGPAVEIAGTSIPVQIAEIP